MLYAMAFGLYALWQKTLYNLKILRIIWQFYINFSLLSHLIVGIFMQQEFILDIIPVIDQLFFQYSISILLISSLRISYNLYQSYSPLLPLTPFRSLSLPTQLRVLYFTVKSPRPISAAQIVLGMWDSNKTWSIYQWPHP